MKGRAGLSIISLFVLLCSSRMAAAEEDQCVNAQGQLEACALSTPFVSPPLLIPTTRLDPIRILNVDVYKTRNDATTHVNPVAHYSYGNIVPKRLKHPYMEGLFLVTGRVDICIGGPRDGQRLPQQQPTYWYNADDAGQGALYPATPIAPFNIVHAEASPELDKEEVGVERSEGPGLYVLMHGPDLPYCRPYTSRTGRSAVPIFEPWSFAGPFSGWSLGASAFDENRLEVGLLSGRGVVPTVSMAIVLGRKRADVLSSKAYNDERYDIENPIIQPDRELTQRERDLSTIGRGFALNVGTAIYKGGSSHFHAFAGLTYQLNSRISLIVGETYARVPNPWHLLYGVSIDPGFLRF